MINKKIVASGKLSGTKSFKSQLEERTSLDDIEKFLFDFEDYKIKSEAYPANVIHIDSNEELSELFSIENELGIHFSKDNSCIAISSKNAHYIITTQNVSHESLAFIFSNDSIIKYVLNSYTFLKWLGDKEITPKKVFDIPTYIKLFTNYVDATKDETYYLHKYSNYTLSNDFEKDNITFSSFILSFGQYLNDYAHKFDLNQIANLINQNAYFEINMLSKKPVGTCIIQIQITNFEKSLKKLTKIILEHYNSSAYAISPLNRIIPYYNSEKEAFIEESLIDDFSNTLLNEFYNDNIPMHYDIDYGIYTIICKQKNLTNIINILQSDFYEVFNTIFDDTPEIKLTVDIKY